MDLVRRIVEKPDSIKAICMSDPIARRYAREQGSFEIWGILADEVKWFRTCDSLRYVSDGGGFLGDLVGDNHRRIFVVGRASDMPIQFQFSPDGDGDRLSAILIDDLRPRRSDRPH